MRKSARAYFAPERNTRSARMAAAAAAADDDNDRTWPGYKDFALVASLPASRGRLYVLVDPRTRALRGEALAAGGEAWGAAALAQLNARPGAHPVRGFDGARRAISIWRPMGIAGGGAPLLWYRSPIRQHRIAARAGGGEQDAAFVREGMPVVLVHARWYKSAPHVRPAEPTQPGDDAARLHQRAFAVGSVLRLTGAGREPHDGGAPTLAIRTALVQLRGTREARPANRAPCRICGQDMLHARCAHSVSRPHCRHACAVSRQLGQGDACPHSSRPFSPLQSWHAKIPISFRLSAHSASARAAAASATVRLFGSKTAVR